MLWMSTVMGQMLALEDLDINTYIYTYISHNIINISKDIAPETPEPPWNRLKLTQGKQHEAAACHGGLGPPDLELLLLDNPRKALMTAV
jgi:hypothetical protein